MNFIQFLKNRHLLINGAKKLKDNSVRQYNSRLNSMIDQKIYNGEKQLNEDIVGKIKDTYADRANEYERTLKYYIEYKNHLIQEGMKPNE